MSKTVAFQLLKLLAIMTGILSCVTASAHHSTAMFDRNQTITLAGTIKKFEYTNPHVWIWLVVENGNDVIETWGIEGAAPVQERRQGMKWDSLKAGDKVSITIHPLRSGETGGMFMSVQYADGSVFKTTNPAAYEFDAGDAKQP